MVVWAHWICIKLLLLLQLELLLQRICAEFLYNKLMLWLSVRASSLRFINHWLWYLYFLHLGRRGTLCSNLGCRFLFSEFPELLLCAVCITTFIFLMLLFFAWTSFHCRWIIFSMRGLILICLVSFRAPVLLSGWVLLLALVHLNWRLLHVKIHIQGQICGCGASCLLHCFLFFRRFFINVFSTR